MLWVWSLSISPAVHVSDTLLIGTALWVMSRRHCCDKLKELLWDFSASWTHFKSSGKVTTHGCGGGVVRVSAADNGETGCLDIPWMFSRNSSKELRAPCWPLLETQVNNARQLPGQQHSSLLCGASLLCWLFSHLTSTFTAHDQYGERLHMEGTFLRGD